MNIARIVFCAYPAAWVGLGFSVLHPYVGVVAATSMFCLGWQATMPRPERGERP